MVDGSSGFVVADVSGKGAPAALLTAVTQGVLATQASFGGGPAAALSRVNEILIRRAVGSRFVTLFFAALSKDGRLTCCNGGHNPPFIVSGSTRAAAGDGWPDSAGCSRKPRTRRRPFRSSPETCW